jgi:hypothetical protein
MADLHFNTASEAKIESLIKNKSDFVMKADRGDLMQACARIEKICDTCGFSSRVYSLKDE